MESMVRRRSKKIRKSVAGVRSTKSRTFPGVFRLFQYVGVVLVLVFVSMASYMLISRANRLDIVNKLGEGASQRLLVDREGLKSTLFILRSSHNENLVGVWVVVSNERLGSTLAYYIPPGVYLRDYSGAFNGYVSVADLAYAGEILDPQRDVEYTIWQISNLSGIAIDSYIWVNSDSLNEYSSLFGDISEFSESRYSSKYAGSKDTPISAYLLHSFVDRFSLARLMLSSSQWEQLSGDVYSNMSLGGVVSEIQRLKSVLNAGGVIMFDLSQPWAGTDISIGSDREITIVNYQGVDESFNRYANIVRGREIEREQVKVEVYNASGIPEIAYRYARRLRNSGVSVVRYENAPDMDEKTKVYVTRPEVFKSSLDLVKKILVIDVEEINSRPSFITTGDIVVVLGTDMQSEIDWK